MPLQATSGAASYDAFGGGVPVIPNYIEEVFSTYLYTGNGSTQTITNGIDLSTKGGLVWSKNRTSATAGTNRNRLHDSARGVTITLVSNSAAAQDNLGSASISSFNTNGYTLGGDSFNNASDPWVSWTFRKQPKFFDIVTWTGTGVNRTISHSLGSVPGCIIVKRTDASQDWAVYHRSLANTQYLVLNSTAAVATDATWWNSTTPTSSVFSVGTDASVNASGGTYVAYVYAHDAGGFGLTGAENVISCGSFTTNGSAKAIVNLGYEPQWVLYKRNEAGEDWYIADNMRGLQSDGTFQRLEANTINVEANTPSNLGITATGFQTFGNAGASKTFFYIAIRRGPMKVPTDATKVYTMALATASAPNNTNSVTSGFPVDLWMTITQPSPFADPFLWMPRLTTLSLSSASTGSESGNPFTNLKFDSNTGIANRTGSTGGTDLLPNWMLQRAPSFMDVVCYTGNDTAGRTVTHNLGVVPELMIVKTRSAADSWYVYSAALGNTKYLVLNTTAAQDTYGLWNNTSPTASVFTLGVFNEVNASTRTYVAYLFATCAGVSKVGSYTGTGATQTINCGFTGGARFVMVKRTDSTGAWYVWDTTRGMVSGTDPSLRFNTSASQVNADSVFTIATGFQIVSTAADINANGGTFIFLAIA